MDRDKFNRILRGYWDSQVLFTAVSLGIFDYLSGKEDSCEGVSEKLGLDLRGVQIILNALVALGFIRKRKYLYSNNRFVERHLTKCSEEPLSGPVLHNIDMWKTWGDLPYVVKKGKPRIGYSVTGMFTNKKSSYNFALAMHQRGKVTGHGISGLFNFSDVESILDIGGCTGRYALAIMKVSSARRVHVIDLPEMVKAAKKVIREDNKDDLKSIEFIQGSFFETEPPEKFDLVILSNIVHSLDEEGCSKILGRSRNWLTRGGKLLVHDFTVDPSRVRPASSAMFAVNMLANTRKGNVYTEKSILGLLRKAGYGKFDKKRTSSGSLAVLCS